MELYTKLPFHIAKDVYPLFSPVIKFFFIVDKNNA